MLACQLLRHKISELCSNITYAQYLVYDPGFLSCFKILTGVNIGLQTADIEGSG